MSENAQNYIYYLRLPYKERNKLKIRYSLICFPMAVIIFLVGYLDTYSTKFFAVTIPYVLLIIPVAFLLVGCFNIIGMVDIMSYKTYNKAFIWVGKTSRFILVLCLVCSVSQAVFLVINRDANNLTSDILFFVGMLITLVLSIVLCKYHDRNSSLIEKQLRQKKENKGE